MIVTESFSFILGVSYISLFVLVATLLFLCYSGYKNYELQEQSAFFAGLFSFVGTFALFILLFKTGSDVCLIILSLLFHDWVGSLLMISLHVSFIQTGKQSDQPIIFFHTAFQHRKLITIISPSSRRVCRRVSNKWWKAPRYESKGQDCFPI